MRSGTPRRSFLRNAVVSGGTLALARPAPAAVEAGTEDAASLVLRVRKAMLAMQRRAWEQAPASTAS